MKKLQLVSESSGFEEEDTPSMPVDAPCIPRKTNFAWDSVDPAYPPISYATISGGKKVPILKTLLTSACEKNCNYCGCRAGRDTRRESFTPDDMARIFMEMYRKRYVQGLFLSSGVFKGAVHTQDELLKTAEILRYKYQYRDYLHLKIMPGAEYEQVYQAMKLADRVSVNLEAPNALRLKDLAPMKTFEQQLVEPLTWVEQIRQRVQPYHSWNGKWPSTVTQFVVGGTDESDVELLQISEFLIRRLKLTRTYYSAFSPVPNTPLENRPPESMWRRYRLFQASFLLRDYPFSMEDLPFIGKGYLPLDRDPKLAWAELNLREQPMEVNLADVDSLLHVPGIGPKGASRIVELRRKNPIKSLSDLTRLGVIAKRAAPYVLLNGQRPAFQLELLPV